MTKPTFAYTLRTGVLALGVAALLAACGNAAQPVPPTRTPAPTFTPTVVGATGAESAPVAVDPNAQQPAPVAPAGSDQGPVVQSTSVFSDIVATPVTPAAPPVIPGESATQPPAAAAPTNTPAPANAQVTISEIANVRGGPGTNYAAVGLANPGQTFAVTGKSADGQWWQITFNGQPGWVFGALVTTQGVEAVAVAQNIPTPPPATVAPVVVVPPPAAPTNTPAPAGPTNTPAPAKSNYKFNITAVSRCERQPAGNWFEGRTYVGGSPANGFKVVFSYAPDAPPITDPVISGPHEGYPGWDTGFYSHIIRSTNPIAGDWYVWIVDDAGQRISEIAKWTSTGPGEGCNQAVVDFDSR